jgi:hypothetical protein
MPTKPKLKTFTYKQIMALKPCYDPVETGFINSDWKGTAKDVLRLSKVPAKDRVWCVLKMLSMQEKNKPLIVAFAIRCAKQAYVAYVAYAANFAYAAYAANFAYAAYAVYETAAEREKQIQWLKENIS